MSKDKDLPEAATQPPPIATPAEDAGRASRRMEREERRAEQGVPSDSARPGDPLRQPGESSSPPPSPAKG
jgi:hypothetical protein